MRKSNETPYLSSSAFSLRGAFDDSGQIEQLDVGAFVFYDAGDARERRELIAGGFRFGVRQRRQQSGLQEILSNDG